MEDRAVRLGVSDAPNAAIPVTTRDTTKQNATIPTMFSELHSARLLKAWEMPSKFFHAYTIARTIPKSFVTVAAA